MKLKNNMMKMMVIMALAIILTILGTQKIYAATATVTEAVVNLREEPNTTSEKLVRLTEGKVVEIIEKEDNWYKVQYGDTVGYLREDLIKLNEESAFEDSDETDDSVVTEDVEDDQEEIEETNKEVEEDKIEEVVITTENVTTKKTTLRISPSINAIEILTLDEGETVEVKEDLGIWIYVESDFVRGWTRSQDISKASDIIEPTEDVEDEVVEQDEIEEPEESQTDVQATTKYVNYTSVNLRKTGSDTGDVIASVKLNAEVKVYEDDGDWAKVKVVSTEDEGYIASRLLSDTEQATSRSSDEIRVTEGVTESSSQGTEIANKALSYLGSPYVYGGTTTAGFDCSGFTQYIYSKFGISIGRSSSSQGGYGTAVSKSELEEGDLLLFGSPINHVGIYIGEGKMVHAANATRGVVIDTINSGYYYTNYVGARRL